MAAEGEHRYTILDKEGQNVYMASRDRDECCHVQVLKDGDNNPQRPKVLWLDTVDRHQSWPSIVVGYTNFRIKKSNF